MTRALAVCVCARRAGLRACTRVATAEDFLCDICRDGCRTATAGTGATVPHAAGLHHRPSGVRWWAGGAPGEDV